MATDRPGPGESDADIGDDRVRDDDFERDFGEAEPPDPLGQAMPDITEAHIAEAGPDGPTPRRRPSRAERAERAARQEAAGRAGNELQVQASAASGEPSLQVATFNLTDEGATVTQLFDSPSPEPAAIPKWRRSPADPCVQSASRRWSA